MSDILTYPIEGVSQLVIETLARDATVRGVPGATAIQIAFVAPARPSGPEFVPEGRAVRFAHAAAERVLVPVDLPVVVREALGDVRMHGLGGLVSLEAVHGDLRLEALDGQVLLAQADADIRAERVAELRILGRCHGDLRFVGGGLLLAEAVDGDLRLSNAAGAQLGRLHGDLWAEKLTGAIDIRQSDGDARLNDIDGPVTVKALSGDLRVLGLAAGLDASQIHGDAFLSGPYAAGSEYSIAADGDIHVNVPADADVRLSVLANGRIRSDVSLTPANDGTPAYSATLGQGASRITVAGRGDLRINHEGGSGKAGRWEKRGRRGADPLVELAGLGDRIRQQVAASLASAGINMETGETNWGWERGRGGRASRGPMPPTPPERPKPPAPHRASSEEQLAILKMVEEGRITPEEADTLLKALGG